ncbi:MAG: acyltransferase [Balneolaceae bacterium]
MNPFDQSLPFEEKTLRVFEFQKEQNTVYGKFCKALGINKVKEISGIPLLPIQAFKDVELLVSDNQLPPSTLFFESSGTSGMSRSKHFVTDPDLYKESIVRGVHEFYNRNEFVILAYTPGYNSNPHSSLIWMLDTLIKQDETGLSQFLELGKGVNEDLIHEIESKNKRVMLFGAAFGLLDLIELGKVILPKDSIIMETGGMKTHRREMAKYELHSRLAEGFNLSKENIHSEYGMTELLSQAYSFGDEWFKSVSWMQVSIRNPENPQEELPFGEEGLIGVIDLANLNSCSFILTGDKGMQKEDGTFQVLGRWNPINLRGCNFLIDQD